MDGWNGWRVTLDTFLFPAVVSTHKDERKPWAPVRNRRDVR